MSSVLPHFQNVINVLPVQEAECRDVNPWSTAMGERTAPFGPAVGRVSRLLRFLTLVNALHSHSAHTPLLGSQFSHMSACPGLSPSPAEPNNACWAWTWAVGGEGFVRNLTGSPEGSHLALHSSQSSAATSSNKGRLMCHSMPRATAQTQTPQEVSAHKDTR